MSRTSKPTNKALVFDPTTKTMVEAATTDLEEMAKRAEKAKAETKKEAK
jgi:hypothetical protein